MISAGHLVVTREGAAVVHATIMDVASKLYASVIYGEMVLERDPNDGWLRDFMCERRQQIRDHLAVADKIEMDFAL